MVSVETAQGERMVVASFITSVLNSLTAANNQIYRVYQNDWSCFEVDYIHKYGEQNYKY